MFPIGTLLYFTPFYFKNGTPPKNKYFFVLDYVDGEMIVAGLPSSKDHSPVFIPKKHGCMHNESAAFTAYYFEAAKPLLDNDWCFDNPTFLYAFWLDTFPSNIFTTQYVAEGVDFEIKGRLPREEYESILSCFIQANNIKQKVRRYLVKALTKTY